MIFLKLHLNINVCFHALCSIIILMCCFQSSVLHASDVDEALDDRMIALLNDQCMGKKSLLKGIDHLRTLFLLNLRKCHLNTHDRSAVLLDTILNHLSDRLSYLYLGFNEIESFNQQYNMQSTIRFLGLAGNQLKSLPEWVDSYHLPLLTELYLSKNRALILNDEDFYDLYAVQLVVAYQTEPENKSRYLEWKADHPDNKTIYLFDREDYQAYQAEKALIQSEPIQVDNRVYHSNNVSQYGRLTDIQYVMMHYTAGDLKSSLHALTRRLSVHYVVPEEGIEDQRTIYQLVDESDRAWHAGAGTWKGIDAHQVNQEHLKKKSVLEPNFKPGQYNPQNDLNSASIGIEIINEASDDNGILYFVHYPEYQIESLIQLYTAIIKRHPKIRGVLGHSDAAPMRKSDPGPLFPWKQLYDEANIGIWYDEADRIVAEERLKARYHKDDDLAALPWVTEALEAIGYAVPGNSDSRGRIVQIFNMRFRSNPHLLSFDEDHYTRVMNIQSAAILAALYKKYYERDFLERL